MRPNTSLEVGKLSQFMDKPTQTHLDSAMMVLQHIKSSPKKRLLFSKGSVIDLVAYVDADYTGFFLIEIPLLGSIPI